MGLRVGAENPGLQGGSGWGADQTVRVGTLSAGLGVLPQVWVCPLLKAGVRVGIPGCSGQPDSFVSPREHGGLALAPAK